MFISFEGIDGSGKTVQANKLLSKIDNAIYLREPGGTQVGEAIRNIVLNNDFTNIASHTEALLYATARAQLVEEVIKPVLKENKIVICDRFIDSSIAYQAIGRNLPMEEVRSINIFATSGILPDITFLIDVDGETGYNRVKSQGVEDRIEKEGAVYYEKVRQAFLTLAKDEPNRFHIINGNQSIDDIEIEIENILSKKYNFKF